MMKIGIRFAVATIAFLVATAGIAQNHEEHNQFNEHDRQAAQDWYKGHQTHAPKGLRSQDQLSAQEEARLERGKTLDRSLRNRSYAVPSDLRRHLPPEPAHHRYMVIGGHVVLVDTRNYLIRDVIHIHP